MQAEIISIGTEITSGAKLDTNSQWLSLQLADLGIHTLFHTTVADELAANVQAFRTAAQRVDLVLITGGLGPTLDDLTREALAAAAGVDLQLDPESLQQVEAFFRGRGYEMPARNRMQAMVPAGAQPLANPVGTAPGIWLELTRPGTSSCLFAALPGVPTEMKKMFLEQVRPRLNPGLAVIRRARINCFGLGESAVEEMLGDLTARGHDPDIGITAHDATITLRIVAPGANEEECQAKIFRASEQIRSRLGDYVFGVEDEELEDVVVRELNRRHLGFATLECGTAGLLASRIGHVEKAAHCYRGGQVLPALTESPQEAARRWQLQTGADFVIYAGAETFLADAGERPVSVIPLGLLGPAGAAQQIELKWSGNPAIRRQRAAKSALDLLRRQLITYPFRSPQQRAT